MNVAATQQAQWVCVLCPKRSSVSGQRVLMLHYQEDVPNTNIVLELGEADFRVGLESGAEEEVGQGGRWRALECKQARCFHLLVWGE